MDNKKSPCRQISFMLQKAIGAPTLFLDFLPIELLSIVIGPYVEIEGTRGSKRPNLSLLLLSPPGIGKKTYLIGLIRRILGEFDHVEIVCPATPEGLIDHIEGTKKGSYLIVLDELGRLMRREKTGRHYSSGLPEVIMKYLDGVREVLVYSQRGEIKRREIRGDVKFVCFIGASQDFFFDREDLTGGWLRRMIVLSVRKNDNPKGYLLEEGDIDPEEVIKIIVEWLKDILRWIWEEKEGRVKVRFSPEASEKINEISIAIDKGERREYVSSLPRFLTIISALIAVSKKRDRVEMEDVEEAEELLRKASKGIREFLRRLRGEDNTLERMLRLVKKRSNGRPLDERTIYTGLRISKDEAEEALSLLEGVEVWREGDKFYARYVPKELKDADDNSRE